MGLWIYRISYFDSILLGFHLISKVSYYFLRFSLIVPAVLLIYLRRATMDFNEQMTVIRESIRAKRMAKDNRVRFISP